MIISIAMTGFGIYRMAESEGGFSIVIVGTGLLFGALAVGLAGTGVLGEMIYRFGDLTLEKYYRYTVTTEGVSRDDVDC